MNKYAVLKDLKGRIAGYARSDQTGVYCRIQLGFPAMLVLLFSDGSQKEAELDGGMAEQAVSCDEKSMDGCYVFREEQLLLVSHEAMRDAFEKRRRSSGSERQEWSGCSAEPIMTENREEPKTEKRSGMFAQRRWPPPPCWAAAQYCRGCWQEQSDQSEPGC